MNFIVGEAHAPVRSELVNAVAGKANVGEGTQLPASSPGGVCKASRDVCHEGEIEMGWRALDPIEQELSVHVRYGSVVLVNGLCGNV
jgi:hypothetical protein